MILKWRQLHCDPIIQCEQNLPINKPDMKSSRWTIPCLDAGCGLKSVDVDHKRGLTCPSPIWIEPENLFLDRKHLRGCPHLSCHGHFLPAASQNVSFHVRLHYKWILRGEIMTPSGGNLLYPYKPVKSNLCEILHLFKSLFFWTMARQELF